MENVGKECIIFYCLAHDGFGCFSSYSMKKLQGLKSSEFYDFWVAVLAEMPNTFLPDSWMVEIT